MDRRKLFLKDVRDYFCDIEELIDFKKLGDIFENYALRKEIKEVNTVIVKTVYMERVKIRPNTKVIPDMIIDMCCEYSKIRKEFAFNKSRLREKVINRQLIAYFLNKYTGLTDEKVGKILNRDRTTVIHSINFIEDVISIKHPIDIYNAIQDIDNKIQYNILNQDNDAEENKTMFPTDIFNRKGDSQLQKAI